jgi:hypothetical protein
MNLVAFALKNDALIEQHHDTHAFKIRNHANSVVIAENAIYGLP